MIIKVDDIFQRYIVFVSFVTCLLILETMIDIRMLAAKGKCGGKCGKIREYFHSCFVFANFLYFFNPVNEERIWSRTINHLFFLLIR